MVKLGGGGIDHGDIQGVGVDDHHTEEHALADHTGKNHSVLLGVGVDDHHDLNHATRHMQGGSDSLVIEENFALIRLFGH